MYDLSGIADYIKNDQTCFENCPVNECQDNGCKEQFNGLGECVDVTYPAWDELNHRFDILEVVQGESSTGLCSPSLDDSCCRCMKMKTCKDNGCEAQFEGNGKEKSNIILQ